MSSPTDSSRYSPALSEKRAFVEGAHCATCGNELQFGTDEIGRTTESCRTCRTSKVLVRRNPSRTAPELRKAMHDEYFQGQRDSQAVRKWSRFPRKFGPKQCRNVACGKTFTPHSGRQERCDECRKMLR